VLGVLSTGALALSVRSAWRTMAEEQFSDQFQRAIVGFHSELEEEKHDLPKLLGELCAHDPLFDAALLDLHGGTLDSGRRLAIGLEIPELMKAVRLSELSLVTDSGEILGDTDRARAGVSDASLARVLESPPDLGRLRTDRGPLAIEAHCVRSYRGTRLGLVGARRLDGVLSRAGSSQGLTLSFEAQRDPEARIVASVDLPELPGTPIFASEPRLPLTEALSKLDRTILVLGALTLVAAAALSVFLSRGLAGPIVRLAEQVRRVVTGDPVPVETHGGRELTELATSFNQTIADLVALRKRLAATERIAARREIARRVAHEIKNPLAPIRAAVETLRRLRARSDPAFDEYFDEATRTVLDEVQRITAIVQEFTRFSRLPPPAPADMDVVQTVRDVVTLHGGDTGTVTFSAGDVPHIVADRDQVVQVVTNLLQNALDAVAAIANPRVTVELSREGASHVKLVVRDNGPGVAPEMRGRLFEPYATTKEHGTGLGLAIVERIVVEHGGEITYRDAPGGGAEMTVLLPVQGPTLLPEAPPDSARTETHQT